MGFRPASARWFEIVVPREDAQDAVEALARQGGVQFEWAGTSAATGDPNGLSELIARYRDLARDYARFWPEPVFEHRCCTLPVEKSAKLAVHSLTHWRDAAMGPLQELEGAQREREAMDAWHPVLGALTGSSLDMGALAAAGPTLVGCCEVLPEGVAAPEPGALLCRHLPIDGGYALIGVLTLSERARLCAGAEALHGRCLAIPDWFAGDAAACAAALTGRLAETEGRIGELEAQLRRLALDHGVDRASGVLERLDWFQDTARSIACEGQYCWVTGWTSAPTSEAMDQALHDRGVRASVAFVEPPADAAPPSVTDNPTWLRPFEVFTHAMGVPGATEADPTPWVALLVSLMFGYMCGDVGHGALIVTAGLWLRRRNAMWPLLVACGLAACGFGFAYGDIFGYGGLFAPLWLAPLDAPMTLLATPIMGGALIMTLGVVLHAVQSCWRGEGATQRVADAAQLLVYWGLPLSVWNVDLGWIVVAGIALCAANRLWFDRSLLSMAAGLGALVESTFTLLLNTLSFARVGAFALAHAALESAVIGVAGSIEDPLAAIAVVVLGNLAVIVVEGVAVMIQTTRLILFEFFVRFFEGRGRAFCPASSPGHETDKVPGGGTAPKAR
jgi:V/A-type H+-transporting ATPase subunit I